MSMDTCAARPHSVEHQCCQLIRGRVREPHGDLDLGEEPLPRSAAVQRHVGARDADLLPQVARVALNTVEIREEIGSCARRVLRSQSPGAALALRRGRCELHQLVLQAQRGRGAPGGAADDVLQRAAEGGAGSARAPQHLVGALALLDLARLGLRLGEPRLQALQACYPLWGSLLAKRSKPLLEGACCCWAAEHRRRQGVVAAMRTGSRRAQHHRPPHLGVEAAAEVHRGAGLQANQKV
mmetsp:Transcript_95502/g.269943  ORF Transcript_95502/g.269943 Transcript_95502/m.269943 type:complete len:239 (-) Transcript_95502:809-1525(-)